MSVRHLIVAVALLAGVAVLGQLESTASAQWGGGRAKGKTKPPLFKAEYDLNGKITNIPDPRKDLENYVKFFIWQRDLNNDDKLTAAESKLPPAAWSNYNLNKDEFLDIKEATTLFKEELAKLEEAEKAKAEKAEAAKKAAMEKLEEAKRLAAEKAEAAKAKREAALAEKKAASAKKPE